MGLISLENYIKKSGKTKTHLAKQLGLTTQGLYNKLKGKHDFTSTEISVLCKELEITSPEEIKRIFFNF